MIEAQKERRTWGMTLREFLFLNLGWWGSFVWNVWIVEWLK